MARINSYKELIVWQKGMNLAVAVYALTEDFPREEIYGLISQMRRSSISIVSNIAEGWARKNTGEYIQFLSMSDGSAAELDTQLLLSERLGFGRKVKRDLVANLIVEIQKMLPSMIKSLKTTSR